MCEPFVAEAVDDRYIAWLNDPEVNRYSQRRYHTTSREEAERFLATRPPGDHVLAIRRRDDGLHIGNLQLTVVDDVAKVAEIRLLVGERAVWGRGYGTEAIYVGTRHLFEVLEMNRVEANTCNPAFARCVQKLGWTLEGRLRERFLCDGELIDYEWYAILAREFRRTPALDPVDS